jgi:histidyl-tRNA synthetase
VASLQPVRGTRDLLAEDCRKFRYISQTAAQIAQLYGFEEIETPVLEPAAVFLRTLGDTSDVVTKQMYIFADRGGDELVLRPEGTAGVARAFINEGMAQNVPVKLYYNGPMFRYERPQKGRYRQFYQFGVEILGVEKPQADVEIIAMAEQFLKKIGLQKNVRLHLNTLGDSESRDAYRETLMKYLMSRKGDLSAESLVRLEKNPLRILDSKDEKDQAVTRDAPVFQNSLNPASKDFFDQVCAGLKEIGIEYFVDDHLVRGFDYYCHTVFEFTTTDLGSQNAVLAGGRYDGLIQSMGGPRVPGVGWAMGIDRLSLMLSEAPAAPRAIAIVPMGAETEALALKLVQRLRNAGFAADLAYSGNVGKRMKRADKIKARAALILGSDEVARGTVVLKDLDRGEQKEVSISEIETALQAL